MTLSDADLDAIIKTRTEPGDIVAELAKEVRRLRVAVELSYKIARGHLNPVTLRPRDGFSVFGRSQMYWKGRSDAATEIRGAAEAAAKEKKYDTRRNQGSSKRR